MQQIKSHHLTAAGHVSKLGKLVRLRAAYNAGLLSERQIQRHARNLSRAMNTLTPDKIERSIKRAPAA